VAPASADFSWSALYRLAEVERGGNTRPASGVYVRRCVMVRTAVGRRLL